MFRTCPICYATFAARSGERTCADCAGRAGGLVDCERFHGTLTAERCARRWQRSEEARSAPRAFLGSQVRSLGCEGCEQGAARARALEGLAEEKTA